MSLAKSRKVTKNNQTPKEKNNIMYLLWKIWLKVYDILEKLDKKNK